VGESTREKDKKSTQKGSLKVSNRVSITVSKNRNRRLIESRLDFDSESQRLIDFRFRLIDDFRFRLIVLRFFNTLIPQTDHNPSATLCLYLFLFHDNFPFIFFLFPPLLSQFSFFFPDNPDHVEDVRRSQRGALYIDI